MGRRSTSSDGSPNGLELVYLFWPALIGCVRIVTHPTILPRPLAPIQAMQNDTLRSGRRTW